MPYAIDGPNQTVHVEFTPEELSQLDHKRGKAGLSRPAYLRTMALEGKVTGTNLVPIMRHSELVADYVAEVRKMICQDHPDRWAYEADIERIECKLDQLIKTEQDLITRKMRRSKR